MELGLTFPLQRFLKRRPPPYGTEPDRRFCWDLHVIALQGKRCLLAVHCHSRYAFVRYDVTPLQWAGLPALFREGLLDSLTAAGFSQEQVGGYLRKARAIDVTRTPWPPGGGLSQPGLGGCAGIGLVPGHGPAGPAPAGPRRQHPPQPMRELRWPWDRAGADN